MIQQGFVLMALGMGMVFIFLFIMIFAMNGLARLVKVMEAASTRKQSLASPKADNSKQAAAIAAASQFLKKG